jgi:hypothetical protein
VIRRWKYLILGASNEDQASTLAEAIAAEAPAQATVHTEANPWVHFRLGQPGTGGVPYFRTG